MTLEDETSNPNRIDAHRDWAPRTPALHATLLIAILIVLSLHQQACSDPIDSAEDLQSDHDPSEGDDPISGDFLDGQECTQHQECLSGTCLGDWYGFPAGICTNSPCESQQDCQGADSICAQSPQFGRLCLTQCSSDESCRYDYQCSPVGDQLACLPRKVALLLNPVCESELVTTSVSLGPNLPLMDRRRASFEIATTTTSFALVLFTPEGQVLPERLIDPTGDEIALLGEYAPFNLTARILEVIGPIVVPATPAFAERVIGGSWQVEYGLAGDQSCFFVLESACQGTHLGLNLYFVGTPGLQANNADDHVHLGMMLEEVEQIFRNSGVRLVVQSLRDLAPEAGETFSIIRNDREALTLMGLSVRPGVEREELLTLNVFLVRGFGGTLSNALGVAPGIPGVMGVHGEVGSGVILSTVNLGRADGNRLTGQVLAHELGHFLGLEHTSEIGQAGVFDHLDDTPECHDPGTVGLLGCPDFDNLMFPFVASREVVVLSEQQALVIRSNPLVQCMEPNGGTR